MTTERAASEPRLRASCYESAVGFDDTHCGRPLARLGALRGCTQCGRLFAPAERGGRELVGPVGVRVSMLASGDTGGAYRDAAAAAPRLVLERAWRARWAVPLVFAAVASCFLTLWGGIATSAALGLIGGTLSVPSPVALLMGTFVLVLGGGMGYLAASLASNRTRVVVTPTHVERSEGPLTWLWRAPLRHERAAGDRVLALEVAMNDVRNLGARWPAPQQHQVELHPTAGEAVVLVEQISTSASAETIRELVEDLLAATER